MKKLLRLFIHFLIVVALIGIGYFGMNELKASKPQIKRRMPSKPTPVVRTIRVEPKTQPIIVRREGTVRPLKEINVIPQVGGKVIYVSPNLVNGGEFKRGDLLLRIDPTDYKLALTLAEAKVKDSESKLRLAEEEAAAAREEWKLIHGRSGTLKKPPPLVAREPQLAAARARLDADRADLRKAGLNLERTRLKTPFNGRVSQESVDVGQYVTPGQPLASIYSTDAVEIMVPLEERDLQWIDVPGFTKGDGPGSKAAVRADLGGRELRWEGQVVRAEGKIDERTRMINVVVRVMDPFVKRPPLVPGLFVKVDLEGKTLQDAAVIPRSSLREDKTVWVVDAGGRLRFRRVEVARFHGNTVLVRSGLKRGDLLVTSTLQAVTDGMVVRAADPQGRLIRTAGGGRQGPPSTDQVIATIGARLKLTDQQMMEVRPILLEHIREQDSVRRRFGGKGFSGIQKLASNMQKLNARTKKRLQGVLSPEQLSEYETYLEEQRQKRRSSFGPPG
ncbi:MAG: efflux RND transporter periplasmic adaptor subunit [Deltaproteobacteria bacterium]|nr:efflux RND transporter periplasmic adaptor subunit [Deltaproteobacteria bacterium]MBW2138910.1 efflux RND transporter periplasmic adaptor subunit [Deltaproteobacteria bacterium]